MIFRYPKHVSILSAVFVCFCQSFLAAQTSSEVLSGKKYGIVVAVSEYDDEGITPLPLVANDAAAVANTLHQRGGFEIVPLYESIGVVKSAQTSPTKANIMSNCQRALEKCQPGDTVLLYFSGHGAADPADPNKTYLFPRDCHKTAFPDSFLETAWLRDQLSKCRASLKLLVLDACQSGGEKSSDLIQNDVGNRVSAHELIGSELEGVVTLASCTKNQVSYFWEEKEMSLFSYWFNEGLKGHADQNGNGMVTFNELDEYVSSNVAKTATELKGRKQTPVRIIRSDVSGVPVVIQPRAVSLDVLLDDMAEQISSAMRIYNVKRTGVLEFSTEMGGRVLNRSKYGTFAAYCAERLEERVRNRLSRKDGFAVVTREAIERSLKDNGIGVDDLFRTAVAESRIKVADKPLESYVVGTIESQKGAEVKFNCSLVGIENVEKLSTPRGAALLTENEWGMLGRSAAIPAEKPAEVVRAPKVPVVQQTVTVENPADFLPPPRVKPKDYKPPVTQVIRQENTALVNWIDETVALQPHPLLLERRKLDVVIEVKTDRLDQDGQPVYVPRQAISKQNVVYVPLQRGEVYRIRLNNHYPDTIGARVLVDGLNTLPQKTGAIMKFNAVEEVDSSDDLEMAPRVSLDAARFWFINPNSASVISGFIQKTGSNAVGREFRITDAAQSIAAQKNFSEQLGIITVALYSLRQAPLGSRGPLDPESATTAGEEFTANISVRYGMVPDQLLEMIQIYYASNEAIAEIEGTVKSVPMPKTKMTRR